MSGTEDVLAKMLRAKFRDVEFFTSGFSFSFEHTHVPHLYPDRDAGFIESTGRNPARYSFQAFFRNGNLIAEEAQYPLAWRKMAAAMADRSVGELLHPELGPVKVKAVSMATTWDGTKRDGSDVQLEFVETTDKEDELAALFDQSAAYAVEFEAGQLDKVSTVANMAKDKPETYPSLLGSIKQLTGTIASAKASLGNVAALVESYANAIDDLAQAVDSLDDVSLAPVLEQLRRLHAGVLDLTEAARPKGRPVTLVMVRANAPMSAVAGAFSNSLEDFLTLNPALGSKTSLPAGEAVFVHA